MGVLHQLRRRHEREAARTEQKAERTEEQYLTALRAFGNQVALSVRGLGYAVVQDADARALGIAVEALAEQIGLRHGNVEIDPSEAPISGPASVWPRFHLLTRPLHLVETPPLWTPGATA